MTRCTACLNQNNNWPQLKRTCAFPEGVFSGHNWNCATVNKIRALCVQKVSNGDYSIKLHQVAEQRYALICLEAFSLLPEEDEHGNFQEQPVWLWVSWYKTRGTTEAMWLMFDTLPPRAPTEEECLTILKAYAEILGWDSD